MTDSWWEYVGTVTGHAGPAEIEEQTGISSAALSRWNPRNKGYTAHPDADNVVLFARRYERSPLEALVHAGYITADEARVPREFIGSLRDVSVDVLLGELRRKFLAASEELDHLSELREFGVLVGDRLKKGDE